MHFAFDVFGHYILKLFTSPVPFCLGSDGFTVECATDSSIILAVKTTNWKEEYPTYNTVYYQLNQDKEEMCRLSHKNQTHYICKIVTYRLATKFTVRLRACEEWDGCLDYSRWHTVWTLPPSKQTSSSKRQQA